MGYVGGIWQAVNKMGDKTDKRNPDWYLKEHSFFTVFVEILNTQGHAH